MKYLFGFLLILSVVACATKNSEETAEYQEWKEMQSFHLLMAEAFHPYKDSANLEPAKGLAKEMADEATKWLGTALPEKVDTEEMKQKLQDLNIGSQDFLKIVSESSADSHRNGASQRAPGPSRSKHATGIRRLFLSVLVLSTNSEVTGSW
jgi:hypothetical protein